MKFFRRAKQENDMEEGWLILNRMNVSIQARLLKKQPDENCLNCFAPEDMRLRRGLSGREFRGITGARRLMGWKPRWLSVRFAGSSHEPFHRILKPNVALKTNQETK
jgi:hypothetical protein